MRRPATLEIFPLAIPAVNHVQYRLTANGEGARLKLMHRAMGPIPAEVREGVGHGWDHALKRIAENRGRPGGRRAVLMDDTCEKDARK